MTGKRVPAIEGPGCRLWERSLAETGISPDEMAPTVHEFDPGCPRPQARSGGAIRTQLAGTPRSSRVGRWRIARLLGYEVVWALPSAATVGPRPQAVTQRLVFEHRRRFARGSPRLRLGARWDPRRGAPGQGVLPSPERGSRARRRSGGAGERGTCVVEVAARLDAEPEHQSGRRDRLQPPERHAASRTGTAAPRRARPLRSRAAPARRLRKRVRRTRTRSVRAVTCSSKCSARAASALGLVLSPEQQAAQASWPRQRTISFASADHWPAASPRASTSAASAAAQVEQRPTECRGRPTLPTDVGGKALRPACRRQRFVVAPRLRCSQQRASSIRISARRSRTRAVDRDCVREALDGLVPARLADRHERRLEQRELHVPEIAALAPQQLELAVSSSSRSRSPSCQTASLMLSIARPTRSLVTGVAGQLERALAQLKRAIELEPVRGDHRQPVEGVRLRRPCRRALARFRARPQVGRGRGVDVRAKLR